MLEDDPGVSCHASHVETARRVGIAYAIFVVASTLYFMVWVIRLLKTEDTLMDADSLTKFGGLYDSFEEDLWLFEESASARVPLSKRRRIDPGSYFAFLDDLIYHNFLKGACSAPML